MSENSSDQRQTKHTQNDENEHKQAESEEQHNVMPTATALHPVLPSTTATRDVATVSSFTATTSDATPPSEDHAETGKNNLIVDSNDSNSSKSTETMNTSGDMLPEEQKEQDAMEKAAHHTMHEGVGLLEDLQEMDKTDEKGSGLSINTIQEITVVRKSSSAVIATAETLLELFINQEHFVGKHVKKLFPYEYYCRLQIVLAAKDCFKGIRSDSLTLLRLREMMSNLTELFNESVRQYPHHSSKLGLHIQKLAAILSELRSALEVTLRIQPSIWNSVTLGIEKEGETKNSDTSMTFMNAFIPDVKDLKASTLIGAGGFGAVYKVRCKKAGLIGTVKLVSKENFTNAEQAAVDKISGSVLAHPFVVQYFCCFEVDKAYITIMEYIRGVDLMKVQEKSRFFSISHCRQIAAQMILAIEHFHYRGLIHRDIKVANTLILQTGRIKMIDFDTCKVCMGNFVKTPLDLYYIRTSNEFRDRQTVGTVAYMPPEVLQHQKYGRAFDWWSLGVTVYRMFSGRLPFRGSNSKKTKKAVINKECSFPKTKLVRSSKSEEIRNFILQLLEKKAKKRLGSQNYKDIMEHAFFQDVSWKSLLDAPQAEVIVQIPTVDKVMKIRKGKHQFSPEASKETKKSTKFSLKDVEDIKDKHRSPIFTFIAPVFKRMMEASNKKKECIEYHITEDEIHDADSLLALKKVSSTLDDNNLLKQASVAPDTIDVLVFHKSDSIPNIEGTAVTSEDGIQYFAIAAALEGGSLIPADIIVAVNGISVSKLSEDFGTFLRNVWSQKEFTIFSVMLANPARMARLNKNFVTSVVRCRTCVERNIASVSSSCGQPFGLKFSTVPAFDDASGEMTNIHVVSGVQKDCFTPTKFDGTDAFAVGDVLIEIEDLAVTGMTEETVASKLVSKLENGNVLIKIILMSPLRK